MPRKRTASKPDFEAQFRIKLGLASDIPSDAGLDRLITAAFTEPLVVTVYWTSTGVSRLITNMDQDDPKVLKALAQRLTDTAKSLMEAAFEKLETTEVPVEDESDTIPEP